MSKAVIKHLSVDERKAKGKGFREQAALSAHTDWKPAADRPDPVALLEEQNTTREQDLVPVRHGRMMVSPFTFYRGAAKIMAADLKDTPRAGLNVQLCGDAHLSNFGVFASPERTLLFDLNDFDETLPGPFEYDVKRMAASFTIAARNNGFTEGRDARARRSPRSAAYREAMAGFAEMGTMDIWYAHLSEEEIMAAIVDLVAAQKGKAKKEAEKGEEGAKKIAAKARTRDSLQALSKLAEHVDGNYRIVSPTADRDPRARARAALGLVRRRGRASASTSSSAPTEPRCRTTGATCSNASRWSTSARKVVGVGSVGTRAFIVLLQGRDQEDPLFLQVKEATTSVLEDHLPKSRYKQHGERVVQGQRMMQAASDIYLGWTKGVEDNRYLYWRQLRDMKGSVDVEAMKPFGLEFYARHCGWTLARAHARSGDPVAIAAYLGKSDRSTGRSPTSPSATRIRTTGTTRRSPDAVKSGRLEAIEGV